MYGVFCTALTYFVRAPVANVPVLCDRKGTLLHLTEYSNIYLILWQDPLEEQTSGCEDRYWVVFQGLFIISR